MPKPFEDPENSRFYKSGAELPSYDQVPDDRGATPEEPPRSLHHGGAPEPEELQLARARVYQPTPSPVQAGRARAGEWLVEFEPHLKPGIDPLMGWDSSADPLQQVRMSFKSLEEALAYCRRQRLATDVEMPAPHRRKPKSYTENFLPFDDGGPKPIWPH
ncbi:MAG TPA: ETC complex I subunit [Magnetospirillum sp.]|nr:ETC complex I subunit [Magnetospirillum sp.]